MLGGANLVSRICVLSQMRPGFSDDSELRRNPTLVFARRRDKFFQVATHAIGLR